MSQRFRIVDVPWCEPVAKQCSVRLETRTGQRFTCFVDGIVPEKGVDLEVETFYGIAIERLPFEALFSANEAMQMQLEALGEWDYEAYGQVVEIDGSDLVVDCGGVRIPVPNVTTDQRVLGAWVGFRVERLEAGI